MLVRMVGAGKGLWPRNVAVEVVDRLACGLGSSSATTTATTGTARRARNLQLGRHWRGARPSLRVGWSRSPCRTVAMCEFSSSAEVVSDAEIVRGRVVSHRANFVHVKLQLEGAEGDRGGAEAEEEAVGYGSKDELLCVTRSVLKKMKRQVLVGDFVEVSSVDWTLGHGVVKSVLPRQSIFQTPAVANVEIALVMFALTDPPIEANQVSRFLVAAEGAGLDSGVLVVLNKTDLVSREETKAWVDRLGSWGYRAIPVSASGGEGVGAVCDALEGKLGVVVGPSGVGKSSLINSINASAGGEAGGLGEGEGALLDVGEVSARTGRGKHTTRNISLIRLSNGGFLADTPGVNQPHLVGVASRELPGCFPEIGRRLEDGRCEFKNCSHVHEPGCVVRGDWERYPMYVDLYHQARDLEAKALRTGSKKETREGDSIKKVRKGGKVDVEPRLNRKKHRRTSRKLSKQQFKQAVMEDDWD